MPTEEKTEETIEKKELFVGSKKIAQFHVSAGTNVVGVLYENGQNEDFTAEQWEGVRSESAYDDGEVVIRKFSGLVGRILREMRDARVDLKSKDWVIERVDMSIGENYRQSIAKLYGVRKPEDILLYQIDETLKA